MSSGNPNRLYPHRPVTMSQSYEEELLAAAREGRLKSVKQLLQQGASVNSSVGKVIHKDQSH
jgi:hypothetical protein